MLRATNATVAWDQQKKRWEVHIQFGAEVIKRPLPKHTEKSGTPDSETLKADAIAVGRDEGYDLTPEQVAIVQPR